MATAGVIVRGISAGGAIWPRIVAIWCSCRPLICSGVVFTRNVSAPRRSVTVFSRSSQVQTSPVNVSPEAWAAGPVREAQPTRGRRTSEATASRIMVFMRREVLQKRCQPRVDNLSRPCGNQRVTAAARGARAADSNDGTVTTPSRLPGDGWPFWRRVYAAGDPLPRFTRATAPAQRFDEGDALPPEYRDLLLKMLRHEGERAGYKSL